MSKLNLKEAFSVLPQPLTIITAGDPNKPGKRGGMTAAWVSWVSVNPPLLMVAIVPARFTFHLIKEKREFAVNIVGKSLENAAYGVFGSMSGWSLDKFESGTIRMLEAKSITAPVLADAIAVLECKLEKTLEAGDHVLVIGHVIDSYKLKDEKPVVFYYWGSAELK